MRLGVLCETGDVSHCIYIIHTSILLFSYQILSHAILAVTDGQAGAITFLAAFTARAMANQELQPGAQHFSGKGGTAGRFTVK